MFSIEFISVIEWLQLPSGNSQLSFFCGRRDENRECFKVVAWLSTFSQLVWVRKEAEHISFIYLVCRSIDDNPEWKKVPPAQLFERVDLLVYLVSPQPFFAARQLRIRRVRRPAKTLSRCCFLRAWWLWMIRFSSKLARLCVSLNCVWARLLTVIWEGTTYWDWLSLKNECM